MGGKTLTSLVGSYNNLAEPIPAINNPELILGVLIPLQVLASVCALLRLWIRLRVLKVPGWDDLFVFLSLIATIVGTTVTCVGAVNFGLGKHFLLLGGKQAMNDYLQGFYIGNASYILSTTFIKLALLLQYLRVFDRGFLFRFCISMAVCVAIWGVSFAVIALFPCNPVSGFWSGNSQANCWGFASQDADIFQATFMTHAALNMVFDLIILSIPVLLLFHINVQNKMRWGLLGVLTLGTLANVVSVWRLVSVIEHHAATWPTFDPTWYGCVSIVLGAVEVDMAVICASVPVFWPVLKSGGFQILITREVQVTSRLMSNDDAGKGTKLQYTTMPPDANIGANRLARHESLQSKDGSEENLRMASSGYNSSDGGPLGGSDDMYGLSNMDPSGKARWKQPGTQVVVSAQHGISKP